MGLLLRSIATNPVTRTPTPAAAETSDIAYSVDYGSTQESFADSIERDILMEEMRQRNNDNVMKRENKMKKTGDDYSVSAVGVVALIVE